MNKFIIAGLVGVVVLGAGYSLMASNKEAEMAKMQMMEEEKMMMEKAEMEKMEMEKKEMEAKAMMEKEAMMKDETMMKDEKKMMEGEGDAMMKKDEMMEDEMMDGAMMMKGSYEAYNASKLAMAEKGDVVLFFKASWCPSCRALDADIKANLGSIKEGLTILEVNYDTETALKQKYGVTSQHALVQVDKDGNLIAKWSGSGTLADLTAKVQ
jgi:thiol-disulfide isomerase/thioredoxin